MEQVAGVIDRFCTFPVLEKRRLAELVLFSFLTGNEDMHLKNFSLTTRLNQRARRIQLSPANDLLNTTVILHDPPDEVALPIKGKKRNLTKNDLLRAFCQKRCGVSAKYLDQTLGKFSELLPSWKELVGRSFLSETNRQRYLEVLGQRADRLGL